MYGSTGSGSTSLMTTNVADVAPEPGPGAVPGHWADRPPGHPQAELEAQHQGRLRHCDWSAVVTWHASTFWLVIRCYVTPPTLWLLSRCYVTRSDTVIGQPLLRDSRPHCDWSALVTWQAPTLLLVNRCYVTRFDTVIGQPLLDDILRHCDWSAVVTGHASTLWLVSCGHVHAPILCLVSRCHVTPSKCLLAIFN